MNRRVSAFRVAAGFIAGIAFVLTCANGSDVTSRLFAVNEAQASDDNNCDRWEVVRVPEITMAVTGEVIPPDRNDEYCTEHGWCTEVGLAPDGWEPIGFSETQERWIFRRCVD